MTSGVYSITNTQNGKHYIGSSVNIEARWSAHRSKLRKGTHYNSRLSQDWRLYGQDAFTIEVLEFVLPVQKELTYAEQRWIGKLDSANCETGYNCYADLSGKAAANRARITDTKRAISLRGENSHVAKVSESDVIEIRKRAENGEAYGVIALDYPIGRDAIKSIVYHDNWKHVKDVPHTRRDISGSNHPCTTLSENQVIEIKQRLCNHEKHHIIANDYGVSREVISGIARGAAWDHVPWPCAYQKRKRLTEQEVSEIKGRLENGETCNAIALSIGVDQSYVSRIATEEAWPEVPWPTGRGRAPIVMATGDRLPQTKLTIEQVREIKQRLARGETPRELAAFYPVTRKTISAIRDGENWKYVEIP